MMLDALLVFGGLSAIFAVCVVVADCMPDNKNQKRRKNNGIRWIYARHGK